MQKWSKVVVVGLALAVLFGFPTAGRAQFTFTTNNGNITITAYTGPGGMVTIPSEINFLPVTSIADYAFAGSGVTSVTIPNTVTNIAEATFYYCGSMTNIVIPESVASIGRIAFTGCTGLPRVTIPQSVANFGDGAFSYCSRLTNVSIAEGVPRLGDFMFDHCTNLLSIAIPNSVTNLGYDTFANCSSLTNIAMPASITDIGDTIFGNCSRLTGITIPRGVMRIGDSTFAGCSSLKGIFFAGNAPGNVGLDIFHDAPNVIVYYLPATLGWEATFANRPTAWWFLPNPTILSFEPDFGAKTNGFGFTISWATNASVVVEVSTNLFSPDWQPLQTNSLTIGSVYFSDLEWTNFPERFYRIRSP